MRKATFWEREGLIKSKRKTGRKNELNNSEREKRRKGKKHEREKLWSCESK